ncbi:DUF6483 family protein [Clostridium senegalense]|uniref:DUF6483 family protein n=1 Tax=Clostridium senegalense TaxID=1465809 RepID=UPI00028A0BA4|nr:DUF6483 family protein [Clostridium senegalense]MBU5227138.1 hypothetical protein [Clostridium senegalense]
MALKNDYILKVVERMTELIKKVEFLKKENKSEEAIDEINKACKEIFGFDLDKVERMSYDSIIELLLLNKSTFDIRCEVVAELLSVKGYIYLSGNNGNEGYDCFVKSLNLYLYLVNNDCEMNIFNGNEKVDVIVSKLSQYELPIETEKMVLKYYLKKGKYSNGEDLLFSMIKKEKSEEIFSLGYEFYDTLKKKSSEELELGNFSLEEVDFGLEDLNQLKKKN